MAFIYLGLGTLSTFAYPTMSIGLQSKQFSFHRQNAFQPDIDGHTLGVDGPSDPGDPWIGPQSISWGYRGLGNSLTATALSRSNSVSID